MRATTCRWTTACCALALGAVLAVPTLAVAQERGNPYGEWRYQSADAWGTRYSPLDQVNAENFGDLEVAWIFRGDNFGPVSGHHVPIDAHLHRRHPLYPVRRAPHRRGDGPRDGGDALDLP